MLAVQALGETLPEEKLHHYNDFLKLVAREITNVTMTCADKYSQDPYGYTNLSYPVPLLADLEASTVSPDTRVYLSWGTKEAKKQHTDRGDRSSQTYHNNKTVADQLKKRKAAVKMDCQIGGGHCEADWERLVPVFMDFLWMQ